MDILAVDSDAVRLAKTVALLQKLFPRAAVFAQDDALMAGKYAFNSPVDILFAALDMKRMDGLQMADFVRCQHPEAWVFLTSCPEEYIDGLTFEDEADGFLTEPLSEKKLCRAIVDAQRNRGKKTGRVENIAPIMPGRTEER